MFSLPLTVSRQLALAAIPAAIALMSESMGPQGARALAAVIAEYLPERVLRLTKMPDGPLTDKPDTPEPM